MIWSVSFSDREAITELDAKLKEERKQAGEKVKTALIWNVLLEE